jgi:hypothetical protein
MEAVELMTATHKQDGIDVSVFVSTTNALVQAQLKSKRALCVQIYFIFLKVLIYCCFYL